MATQDIGDRVIDAVHAVCGMIPCWRVPRDYVAGLYRDRRVAERNGGESEDNLDGLIEKLGYEVKERFFSRHIGTYRGEWLKDRVFPCGGADEYIRLLSWARSTKDGQLRLDFC